jgi:hypothetical protein
MESTRPPSDPPTPADPYPCAVCTAEACEPSCRHEECHSRWWSKSRTDGKVYCCSSEGWVTPTEAFEHSWDAYSGWPD